MSQETNYNSDLDEKKNPEYAAVKDMSAKVKFYRGSTKVGFKDLENNTLREFTGVLLTLDMTREQNNVFCRYKLPDLPPVYDEETGYIIKNNPPEYIIELKGPVYGPCRCYVFRQDDKHQWGPYLMVASVGVEEDIKRLCKEGDTLRFDCLSASKDYLGDEIHDPDFENTVVGE